jgi:hypothetical protein
LNYIFYGDKMKSIDEQIQQIERSILDPDLCFGTASTWSRCTGYYRMVEAYNYGKRREYLERNEYNPFGTKGNVNKRWVEKLLHGEKNA